MHKDRLAQQINSYGRISLVSETEDRHFQDPVVRQL